MSAAARGAAGYLYASGRMGQRARARKLERAQTEAAAHLSRFVKSPERARELAAEAAKNFDASKR